MRLWILIALAIGGLVMAMPTSAGSTAAAAPVATTFKPVNVLEELLIEAATNPAKRPEFVSALLASDIYLATPKPPAEEGSRLVPAGTKFDVLAVKLGDGRVLPAMFTSKDRIREYFGPDTGYVQLNGRAAMESLAAQGFVLNPGSDYGVIMDNEDVAMMLGKPVSRTLQRDTAVVLGTPINRPDELIARLQELFGRDKRTKEVWLALAVWPESGEKAWLVQIVSDAPESEIRSLLGSLKWGDELAGYPLDSMIVTPERLSRVGYRIKP